MSAEADEEVGGGSEPPVDLDPDRHLQPAF